MSRILDLPALVRNLPPDARRRAERMFDADLVVGETDPPAEMHAWLADRFGSVDAVRRQAIVRVTNRWTLEGALFSPLRGRRPQEGTGDRGPRQEATGDDPFCHPETGTPAEPWGRVHSDHAVSGANAAKYDGQHGVLVFRKHDPLDFDRESVVDLLHLGRRWADRAREADPAAAAYLLVWNCGMRAGGSIVHGHAQVLLGRARHYARIERLRRDAAAYRSATGAPYLEDLVAVHRDLALVVAEAGGVATVASLTPIKERELLVIGPAGSDERDPAFAAAVARAVVAYRDVLGVRAFNLALHRPPLDAGEAWSELGPVVHLVDRGDPESRSSDIGAMELYAASVVGGDPFEVAERLGGALG
ncbi:MAG: hypothetical protein ACRDHD_06975 [Candidatus Limnocylindria bacterium]